MAVGGDAGDNRVMLRASLVVSLALLVGCEQQDPNAIGTFALEGTRTQTCGETGLLASPTALIDTVLLRKGSQDSMQWQDSNGLLLMELGPEENHFSARRVIVVDMRVGAPPPVQEDPSMLAPPPDPQDLPPCVIQRLDEVFGQLEGGEDVGYSGFEAYIKYSFTPLDGSVCDDLHRADVLATGVPCSIAYDAVGTRKTE